MRSRAAATLGLVGLLAATSSCTGGSGRGEASVDAPDTITVTSRDFAEGAPLPTRVSCDGDGVVPSLSWSGVPEDAASLALVVDDPDAPGGTFVHWVVLDMPADTTSMTSGRIPSGAVQAKSSTGQPTYVPPCPPSGTHHYRFTVYALSEPTGLEDGVDTDRALGVVESSATAQGRLVGTYSRGS